MSKSCANELQGKNIANPMAMILAAGAILRYVRTDAAARASRAIYESVLEAVSDGVRTVDLHGSATTGEFTDEVMRRVKTKLDVWDSLGVE